MPDPTTPPITPPVTPPPEAPNAEALGRELSRLSGELAAAKTAHEAATKEAATWKQRTAEAYRRSLLTGLVNPAVASLAPMVDMGTDGQPTAASLASLDEWRRANPWAFAATPPASPPGTPPPVVPPVNPTPPIDPMGGEWTWDRWRRFEKDNPERFKSPEIQAQLIAWSRTPAAAK
jgi:hypothetical protein